jgi:RNA polymerase sigma-70 factor (ECF subfamily)
VEEELDGLTGAQKRAVELRVVGESSYDAIASALKVSPQAARALVSRGLRTLAERLDADRAVQLEEVRDV